MQSSGNTLQGKVVKVSRGGIESRQCARRAAKSSGGSGARDRDLHTDSRRALAFVRADEQCRCGTGPGSRPPPTHWTVSRQMLGLRLLANAGAAAST